MKKILLLFVIFLSGISHSLLRAQTPMAIPYQAVARDISGNPIASQAVSARFTIHDATVNGTVIYQETQSKTTNSLGLFTANIGQGTAVIGTFSTINWGSASKFLQVEMDPAGGTNYIDMGTQQMLSVPYALYAEKVPVKTDAVVVAGSNNTPSATIPDNNCIGITSTILVSGLPSSVNSSTIRVTLDITHNYAADLLIYLVAPNGNTLCLTSQFGGAGNDFNNTVFSDAAETSISDGIPPYAGEYKPYGTLAGSCGVTPTVNTFAGIGGGTLDPNGIWTLKVIDGGPTDVGTLNSWSINVVSEVTVADLTQFTNWVPKWNNLSSLTPGTIYDNNNIGIGTISPANKLSVAGNADFSGKVGIGTEMPSTSLQVGDYNTTASDNYITVKTQGGNVWKSGIGLLHYADEDGWLLESDETNASFSIKHANSGFTKDFTIDFFDNIGIGTDRPASKLDVMGSGWFRGSSGSLPYTAKSGVRIFYDSTLTAGQVFSYNYESGAPRNLILQGPGGNLGIGTINPVAKLDIQGNVKIADGTQGVGKILTSDANGLASWQVNNVSSGTYNGQMNYWNGTAWVPVASGQNNQTLTNCNGVPTWGPCPQVIPVITTTGINSIVGNTAMSGGNVSYDGNNTVTSRGICWSTSPNPTTALATKTVDGSGTGSFSSSLSGLTQNTLYHVRAYATNGSGTAYGNDITFTSSTTGPATVTTSVPTSITTNTAVLGGNVVAENGSAVTTRGVCISQNLNPTISDVIFTTSGTTGSFAVNATGLVLGVTYHCRAYASNGSGIGYGQDVVFTMPVVIPTVTIGSITSGGDNFNITNNNVSNEGGSAVTSRGVCWSTSANPTIAGNSILCGTGAGVFDASITGLLGSTNYHLRAFATNIVGTSYSNDISITTLSATLPVISTNAVTSLTGTSATCGGNITSNGGAPILARGVCWGTAPNPTISGSHTIDPSPGIGIFNNSMSGLSVSETYYCRAYATNSVGTAYGPSVTFKSLYIGMIYGGGKIAYILQPGDPGYDPNVPHGLIAQYGDRTGGWPLWGCVGTLITGADGTALGTGNQNMIDIMNGCSVATVASYCGNYVSADPDGTTFDDWYLPSKDELYKLYLVRNILGGFVDNSYYYSSSEFDANKAYACYFQNVSGDPFIAAAKDGYRATSLRSRAVRSF